MSRSGLPIELSPEMNSLFEVLGRDSERVFGTARLQIIPVKIDLRESSEVARARVEGPAHVRHVFAKIFKSRPGEVGLTETRIRFRKDYNVTRQVFDAMHSMGDIRSVEPIACYEELLGVVTNEVPGLPLSVAISKDAAWPASASQVAALEAALSRLGRWIAAFQRVAPDAAPSRMDLDATREYIDRRLVKLAGLPRAAFSEADRQEVLAHFDRLAARVPASDLVDVPVHGDIVPSNAVVAHDCVTVLDFGMTARGSKYLDIARLYTQLDFYRAKPQYRGAVITRLQAAALAGFAPGLRADDPLFEICAMQHVVCHLLSHVRQPGPFPVSVYSGHLVRRHRRWLRERGRESAVNRLDPRASADRV